MIEQGIQILVQGNAAVAAIAATGGFAGNIPAGTVLPSWKHTLLGEKPEYNMQGASALSECTLQIDCFANNPDDAFSLAIAIDAVLSGYRGQLADDDALFLQRCLRTDHRNLGQDPDARDYRRMLVYDIAFSTVAP